MDSGWKIRLLGGVLHGREIWLNDEHLSVGERGCDLCVPLCGSGRLELTATDAGLLINAGGAAVRVNGRRHNTDKLLTEEGVVQALGLTLAYGRYDTDLSGYPKRNKNPVLFCAMVLACLCLTGTAAFAFLNSENQPPPVAMTARVTTLLKQTGLTEVSATWEKNGTLWLSGYCGKSDSLQNARLKLSEWGVLYRDNVVCTDQLIRLVRDVLIGAGYDDAELTSDAPGDISINADISMGKRWAGIQRQLTSIPGLKHLYVNNRHRTEINALIAELQHQALAEKLSVTSAGQAFVISGVLDVAERQSLEQLLAQLRLQFPGILLSYQNMASSGEGGHILPSPVAAIVHSRQGLYLLLEDGERLRTGSHLPNGAEVIALTDAAIAFKFPDSLVNYPFNF